MSARSVFVIALLLLVGAFPAASAQGGVVFAFDAHDLQGDVAARASDGRTSPVARPGADVLRLTTAREGDDLVATVHLAGPVPTSGLSLTVGAALGSNEGARMVLMHRVVPTANGPMTQDMGQVVNPASGPRQVPVRASVAATSIELRIAASEVAFATCFAPHVELLHTEGGTTYVDDLVAQPAACLPSWRDLDGVILDGAAGACPAPATAPRVAYGGTDPQGDVVRRTDPAQAGDAATHAAVDILAVNVSYAEGRVVHVVTVAADFDPRNASVIVTNPLARDDAAARIEVLFTTNKDMGIAAYGTRIQGETRHGIWTNVSRDARTMTLAYCASVVPADATCVGAKVEVQARDASTDAFFVDRWTPPAADDPCDPAFVLRTAPTGANRPGNGTGNATGTTAGGNGTGGATNGTSPGGEAGNATGDGASDGTPTTTTTTSPPTGAAPTPEGAASTPQETPGAPLVGLLAALLVLALALRRR